LLSANTAPTTIIVERAAAAITAALEKLETKKVQQLLTRKQKAKRPIISSRAAKAPAMM
jgi:hypothetical protein